MDMKFAARVAFLCMIFTLSGCIPKPITVEGDSMSPTINNGDVILLEIVTEDVKRGEIIYLLHPQESYSMIARVVGLPGEEVLMKDNKVYIGDRTLEENYILSENNKDRLKEGRFKMENDHYFVLGDNRDNSLDSRYFGSIARESILAKYHSTYRKAEKR